MRLVIAVLFAFACLGGCASAAPPPKKEPLASEAEIAAAQQAYFECMTDATLELDDGVSDAASIGSAVSRSCNKSLQKVIAVNVQGKDIYWARSYIISIQKSHAQLGTSAVLKTRSLKRQQKSIEMTAIAEVMSRYATPLSSLPRMTA